MEAIKFLLLCTLALAAVDYVSGDIPVDCRYEQIKGTWKFEIGPNDNDRTVDCSKKFKAATTMTVTLSYPNNVTDQYGNKGTWTLIYNEGYEFIVAGRKYFSFSYFDPNTGKAECNRVEGGWSHDVLGNNWACYRGKKVEGNIAHREVKEIETDRVSVKRERTKRVRYSINSQELVDKINNNQKLWQAKRYPQFEGYTIHDYLQLAGGVASKISAYPRPSPLTARDEAIVKSLPKSFDWRNVDGVNYVSPVRDQGGCGSCYAFASMGMAEARARIQTNNTQQPVYSPQDIVECCEYSQGCNGGFNYLVAGKYAEDFGLVLEKCNPYKGRDHKCSTDPKCERHYFTDYSYIGGYYGACNEAKMLEAIYKRGPIAIGVNMPGYFFNYGNGILTCQKNMLEDVGVKFDPFKPVDHGIVIVGWGYDDTVKEKYWIIKNSWGKGWGDKGYGKIRRGIDDCNIESIAMEASPIFKF